MKITMTEQVLRGNFGGDTDAENQAIAERYVSIMEDRLMSYCEENYPGAEIAIDFSIESATGYSPDFEVDVEADDDVDVVKIIRDIETKYQFIAAELGRTGEIYEVEV